MDLTINFWQHVIISVRFCLIWIKSATLTWRDSRSHDRPPCFNRIYMVSLLPCLDPSLSQNAQLTSTLTLHSCLIRDFSSFQSRQEPKPLHVSHPASQVAASIVQGYTQGDSSCTGVQLEIQTAPLVQSRSLLLGLSEVHSGIQTPPLESGK